MSFLLVLGLFGCRQAKKENGGADAALAVDPAGVYFDSIEQLFKTIGDYPAGLDKDEAALCRANGFDEIAVDCYPQITDKAFVLLKIEVNPFSLFYYYVPAGTLSFSPSSGVLVTVPREKEATIAAIERQFGVSAEADGSIFVSENRSRFVPMGSSYYKISYPDSMQTCEKDLIRMIRCA